MARCDRCGNEYDKSFEVILAGDRYVFDSFECAVDALAPICASCGIRILGHGVEARGTYYCCANCAEKAGVRGIEDRVH